MTHWANVKNGFIEIIKEIDLAGNPGAPAIYYNSVLDYFSHSTIYPLEVFVLVWLAFDSVGCNGVTLGQDRVGFPHL
jgi:hypothetical protein